ncbi:MAG: hypothetical protein D6691_05010 [Candidatus Hydrogenedentota bacterium]|nr:MAG: hypothetical protein D6691_05010 [Candidatus Hydrogenedentota bacterium]
MKGFLRLVCLSVALSWCMVGAAQSASRLTSGPKLLGVWVRPEASKTSVTKQLDDIQRAGFNAVYVETFYHGFSIFPSQYMPQRPEMRGTDYLRLYIQEGKRRGLKIHAWIETFYWEVDTKLYPQFPKTPLFEKHPEWRARLRDGNLTDKAEPAHIFANPAHPEVRKLLADYIEEIARKYDVAGINLDYIRYPDGKPDAGYDDYTRKLYKQRTGVDPLSIERVTTSPEWQRWVEFREEQVLTMVRMARDRVKASGKPIELSAAIFAGPESARYESSKFQNWREMLRRGYLDAICPMVYDSTLQGIENGIIYVREATPPKSKTRLLPIFAVQRRTVDQYSGPTHPPIREQAALARKLGVDGFSIFCYSWILDSDEGLELLRGIEW